MSDQQSINFTAEGLPKIAGGSGSYVFDVEGKRYLDGSGGPAAFCIGHAHPEVNAAITAQLEQIAHAYRYMFTSDPLEQLTARIARLTDEHFPNMVFVTGGSEAVESSLKLALQYWSAKGRTDKRRFIARRRSWHGNTLGALSVSHFEERRAPFESALIEVSHVSPANAYRPPEGVSDNALVDHLMAELEAEILAVGAERVAAFIFEPVVGAAGGVVPAPPGYAQALRRLCDRHDILLIADEVMCGVGRCGTWRALEHDGVLPDIMAIAKGLGGGYIPLGAALYSEAVAGPIQAAYGGALTGHTFTGHTAACAAGLAVQEVIARDGLVERVHRKGFQWMAELREAFAEVEEIGDLRGRGFFVGLEFVADRATQEPFAAERRLSAAIAQAAMARGLICYPCNGNVDGRRGDTIILAPPYNASDGELEAIRDILLDACKATLAGGAGTL
jgi:adenosylmethionine-8-amino-7-oxononanoate aminotransferase